MVKRAIALAAALAAMSPVSARSDQAPQPIGHALLRVKASQVRYFADLAVVQARGGVDVLLPDGAEVRGDIATVDLRLRRIAVAGHVILHTPAGDFAGAGFADFFAFRRAYFLPLVPSADRWTFLNGDWSAPEKGREMPGDAFALPDFEQIQPYIEGTSVAIDFTTFARFAPASIRVFDAVPTPSLPVYVYNFSANQNFGVNSLSGASFDAPYAFAGSADSLDALHVRYDQTRPVKEFWSFEHHSLFGDAGYAVFSLNPASEPAKQWNLLGYDQVGARAGFAVNAQLFTVQSGLSQPTSSSGFADVQFTQALQQSALRLDATQSYDTLLAAGEPDHPFVLGLQWTGYDQPLFRSGFTYRLQSGFAHVHDAFGIAGQTLPDVWSHYLGAYLATPEYQGPAGIGFDVTGQIQRTWLSFPNAISTTALTASASKQVTPHIYVVATQLTQTASATSAALTFASPNTATGLTPAPQSPNGLPVYGVATVVPDAVSRNYILSGSWQPSTAFQFSAAAQQTFYSPVQTPGLFSAPRYQLNGDVRFRITRTLFADVSRGYLFNWGGRVWTPQFGFQVSAQ
jgi:hypothetical protein